MEPARASGGERGKGEVRAVVRAVVFFFGRLLSPSAPRPPSRPAVPRAPVACHGTRDRRAGGGRGAEAGEAGEGALSAAETIGGRSRPPPPPTWQRRPHAPARRRAAAVGRSARRRRRRGKGPRHRGARRFSFLRERKSKVRRGGGHVGGRLLPPSVAPALAPPRRRVFSQSECVCVCLLLLTRKRGERGAKKGRSTEAKPATVSIAASTPLLSPPPAPTALKRWVSIYSLSLSRDGQRPWGEQANER